MSVKHFLSLSEHVKVELREEQQVGLREEQQVGAFSRLLQLLFAFSFKGSFN